MVASVVVSVVFVAATNQLDLVFFLHIIHFSSAYERNRIGCGLYVPLPFCHCHCASTSSVWKYLSVTLSLIFLKWFLLIHTFIVVCAVHTLTQIYYGQILPLHIPSMRMRRKKKSTQRNKITQFLHAHKFVEFRSRTYFSNNIWVSALVGRAMRRIEKDKLWNRSERRWKKSWLPFIFGTLFSSTLFRNVCILRQFDSNKFMKLISVICILCSHFKHPSVQRWQKFLSFIFLFLFLFIFFSFSALSLCQPFVCARTFR